MNLNEQQKRIVERPVGATLKVSAGAGTGKTRVLVERYLRFVLKERVDPDHLLALTFTKKAAAEMQGRVYEAVVERGDKHLLRKMYGAWIMNFHQFAYRLIREHATAFGIDPDVRVASEVEVERAKRNLRNRFDAGTLSLPAYDSDMPPPNRFDRYFDKCMKIVDKARGAMWTPESLRQTLRKEDTAEYRRYIDTVVVLWEGFEAELRERLLLDFSDLIRIVVAELENNDTLRSFYQEKFVHILVDEFQDTSMAQGRLLELLSGDFSRTTVVGDEKQSIYRWRDARIENMRGFPGEEEYLSVNYRSRKGILDAAHRLIVGDEYFAKRADKIRLESDRGPSDAPICLVHPAEDGASEVEARALGAWITALTSEAPVADSTFAYYREHAPRLAFDRIAILMRTLKPSSGLPAIESELQRLRIPYAIVGGVSDVEDGVLEQFKNVLRLLVYPNDVTAFLSVLESRPFLVPDRALGELFRGAGRRTPFHVWSRGPDFAEQGLLSDTAIGRVGDGAVRERLVSLRDFIESLDEHRGRMDLPAFITQAMDLAQFYYRLFDDGADMRVVDSVSKRIFELIEQLVQKGEPNLAAFIEAVETLLMKKQFGEEDAPYVPEGRVVIMTQHQAKGLEWPAVAIAGIKSPPRRGDGFMLVEPDGLFVWEDHKEGGPRGKTACPAYEAEKKEQEQEERCLLYVAMTRAEDHLFLSTPFPGGLGRHKKPTLFTSVLESMAGGEIPYEEKRDVEPAPSREARATVPEQWPDPQTKPLIEAWRAGHERIEETRSIARPALGGVELVSWRGLNAFDRCPLEFYYAFVARVQEDLLEREGEPREEVSEFLKAGDVALPKGVAPAEFGSYVHRLLFEGAGEPATRERALDLAKRMGLPSKARASCAELAAGLVSRHAESSGPCEVRYREWPVRRRVGNVIFHGVIDRVDRIDDGLAVIDYKIGLENERYDDQIRFYAWLLGAAQSDPVTRGTIVYLQDDLRTKEIDVSAVGRLDEVAASLAEAVDEYTYHASPGVVCATCDFRSVCPYAVVEAR